MRTSMRRQQVVVSVAIATMVALAFVVPLVFLVRTTARDRALDQARADAAAIAPVAVADADPVRIAAAVGATTSGAAGRLSVVLADGSVIGAPVDDRAAVDEALARGASSTRAVDGGDEVVVAVVGASGTPVAIRVVVPTDLSTQGTREATLALVVVAVVLVAIAVFVADRLSREVVRPAEALASAARRLGDGDLGARVEPEGPAELRELAERFNDLSTRVADMLERERELVADLSHRLRTPMTRLRMRLELLGATDVPEQLRDDLQADLDALVAAVDTAISDARRSLEGGDSSSDVAAVVMDRVEFWSALSEDQERPWNFERSGPTRHVPVDAADLAAALDVLLDNVFAHTPDGTSWSVGVTAGEDRVRIVVADDGPGADAAELERGVSGAGSTGLGLDIARRTVVEAGGTFAAGPGPEGGYAVELELPVTTPS